MPYLQPHPLRQHATRLAAEVVVHVEPALLAGLALATTYIVTRTAVRAFDRVLSSAIEGW